MNQIVVSQNTIALSGGITRANVGTLRDELLAALTAPSKPRVVRLAEVDVIDSAGVQLLCALRKGFPQVQIKDTPDAVRSVLARLGASGLFEGG